MSTAALARSKGPTLRSPNASRSDRARPQAIGWRTQCDRLDARSHRRARGALEPAAKPAQNHSLRGMQQRSSTLACSRCGQSAAVDGVRRRGAAVLPARCSRARGPARGSRGSRNALGATLLRPTEKALKIEQTQHSPSCPATPLLWAISIGVDARVTPLDPRGNSKAIATEQRVPVIAFPLAVGKTIRPVIRAQETLSSAEPIAA